VTKRKVPAGPPDNGHLVAQAGRVRELLAVGARPVDLAGIDTRATPGLPDSKLDPDRKTWSRSEVAHMGGPLASHQERLYARALVAGDPRRFLLVLQALDCGGKDGTIKSVVRWMNPQGVGIKAFGPPTEEERRHHFLWRIRNALPPAGYVGVFNRSQYEDVLAARVRRLVPKRTWQARYDEINRFEEELVAGGTTIVKVMLHISYEEQRKRLLARLEDPTKRWKFNPSDLDDRALWPAFQAAYEDALTRCNTETAPWYVVPADRKWYRNWAVANLLLAVFDGIGLTYPEVDLDVPDLRKRLESDASGNDRDGERKVN